MENKYLGSCLCGLTKYEVKGDFDHFFLCHCTHCQKDTGSAHAANLFSTRANLKWMTGEDNVKTFNLPSTRHVKSFCKECGSALPSLQMQGQLLVIPAGSLDTKLDITPNAHLFYSSKALWEDGLDNIAKFEKLPS